LPTIDLGSSVRSETAAKIVKASEEVGFFQVVNHGVPPGIISRIETEAEHFFSKPNSDKERAGPPNPYGYGCRNIGQNGDTGEVEYLLLHAGAGGEIPGDSFRYGQRVKQIIKSPNDPYYVSAIRELACEILDLMELELCETTSSHFMSGLIRHVDSDSALRFNHYRPSDRTGIGFGEHTDPQMLTLLRSNGVEGLQISLQDGVWFPVPANPSAFCVNVGDALQVMTNGRFKSVRHRAVVNSYKSRMSIAYFAAPPLDATVGCLPGVVKPIYRSFSWGEYKKAAYSSRLGDSRLNLFKLQP
ncbi:hypothetical protein M569_05440, partial [Genlisea aurea]